MAYLGTQPNDVKKNIGLYTPSEILQLEKDGHWGGSLELIAEKTVSGSSTINFTSIKENVYDVHLMQLSLIEASADMDVEIRLSNDGGSNFEDSNYIRAVQYCGTNGVFGVSQSTSATQFDVLGYTNTSTPISAYVYLYNLGSSSKFSFITQHSTISTIWSYFGGQGYMVAETINALQLLTSSAATFTGGTAKLFGVKE